MHDSNFTCVKNVKPYFCCMYSNIRFLHMHNSNFAYTQNDFLYAKINIFGYHMLK
ncbi:hypothetical protein CI610_03754 [invertebrate metagenome]|uniref:Uncharacterized protein n=1 Tax=invertebrate metagenome TaxID=1711999 RepID=A0A2H9T294_9ZZZZ